MDIGEYIKYLRTAAGLSQEELGKIVGVQRAAVQKWESGTTQNLKRETIKKLADYFKVSPIKFVSPADISDDDIDLSLIKNIAPIVTKKIPLLGSIACGKPIFAEENYDMYIDMASDINADFCLTAKGDSMIGARINDGDLVFIRKQPDVNNGEIAVVLIDDEATLKRVYKTADTLTLVAENPAYPPMVYTESNYSQIRILGRAIAFQSIVK